ncbi:MAG: HEAT repeat domain-containing protein [Sandaracinaceae bacterium]|nr:HEAT repeat domain-containing protein [Sandaracinaceae bacterium]
MAGLSLGLAFAPALAQTDHATVIRVLEGGRDFRARARAALALGSSADPAVVPALIAALEDANPAVRAAAATGLGRLADARALPPLRVRLSDPERAVRAEAQRAIAAIEIARARPAPSAALAATLPASAADRLPSFTVVPRAQDIVWSSVRYVVVLGTMENRSRYRDDGLSGLMASEVGRSLVVLRGVATFPDGQVPPEAEREIQRRRLPKLRLEGSLNRVEPRVEPREMSVRCEVSLMLLDDAGRNMRSVLNGAATGVAPRAGARPQQEQRLARQALSGAVRSAMQGAAHAISSAAR